MQAQVPALIAEYFGGKTNDFHRGNHPTIEQAFSPSMGWRTYPLCKRVSVSWLRKMRAQGITAVSVRYGARVADFSIKEVLARPKPQPLLGGSLIGSRTGGVR